MAMLTFGICLLWWFFGHMSYKTAKKIDKEMDKC